MTKQDIFDLIVAEGIATEEEVNLVTCVAGYTVEVLNAIVYARTGYQDIEQYEDETHPDSEPYDIDSDFGYDPYMGSYSYDC